jgi:hypothetical protein
VDATIGSVYLGTCELNVQPEVTGLCSINSAAFSPPSSAPTCKQLSGARTYTLELSGTFELKSVTQDMNVTASQLGCD